MGQVEGKQEASKVKLVEDTQRVSGEGTANALPMGDTVPGTGTCHQICQSA